MPIRLPLIVAFVLGCTGAVQVLWQMMLEATRSFGPGGSARRVGVSKSITVVVGAPQAC